MIYLKKVVKMSDNGDSLAQLPSAASFDEHYEETPDCSIVVSIVQLRFYHLPPHFPTLYPITLPTILTPPHVVSFLYTCYKHDSTPLYDYSMNYR